MFENLLQLAADDDKATLTTMAGKYPTLKEYFELGERLKPVQDRLKALAPNYADDLDKPVAELEKWHGWKKDAWPTWQADHIRIETALAEATAEITELQNNRSAEVTPDEIKTIVDEALKTAGVVRTADLDAKMTALVNEKVNPAFKQAVDGLTNRFEKVYQALTPKAMQHYREFNEDLDYEKVFTHMKTMAEDRFKSTGVRQDIDPLDAYKDLYATKFSEKSTAQIAADKKAEYEKGVAEGKKTALKEVGAQRSPVDGGQPSVRPGALMRRAQARMPKDKDGAVDSSKIPLGKGIFKAATQEYYNKKAEAVQ